MKKLALNKETIKILSAAQLAQVISGVGDTSTNALPPPSAFCNGP